MGISRPDVLERESSPFPGRAATILPSNNFRDTLRINGLSEVLQPHSYTIRAECMIGPLSNYFQQQRSLAIMYCNRSESDALSTATDLTTSSDEIGDDFNREVNALLAFIKVDMRKFKDSSEKSKQALGRPQTARDRTFVVVCGERGADRLNKKLESLKRHPLKFWKKRFWRGESTRTPS